jgi:hypothetical protein
MVGYSVIKNIGSLKKIAQNTFFLAFILSRNERRDFSVLQVQ